MLLGLMCLANLRALRRSIKHDSRRYGSLQTERKRTRLFTLNPKPFSKCLLVHLLERLSIIGQIYVNPNWADMLVAGEDTSL